jgi:tRNA1(Val) A37 N6-methylase TrmN6
MLSPGERIDKVNDNINLIQKTDGLTFGTDALLLAAYVKGKYKRAVEIGGGTGIVSLLIATRNKVESIDCVEVQKDFYELIGRNCELNRLSNRIFPVLCDVRDYKPEKEYELCFSNPPYMKKDAGKANDSQSKNAARHEENGTILEICRAAAGITKYGGTFAVVYRTDRLCDLIFAMRQAGFEPKRMTLVHADEKSAPSMALIEAKKGGKCGLKLTRPLIIYNGYEHKTYTEEMNYIMQSGNFPPDFGV